MSSLTKALDRILNWLVKNNPELALSLQPGLTRAEIDQQIMGLPFTLPEEVYELYQWRNGDRNWEYCGLLPGYGLLPLSQAIEEYTQIQQYQDDLRDNHPEEVWQKPWFPVLMFDGKEYLLVVCETEKQEASPVWWLFLEDGVTLKYPSLTSLFLMAAECYETGAYYLQNKYLEQNEEQVRQIQQKYNPEIAISTPSIPSWLMKSANSVDLTDPTALEQLTQALHAPPSAPEEVALQYMAARTLENLEQVLPPELLQSSGDSVLLDPNHEDFNNVPVSVKNPAFPLIRTLQNLIYDGVGHEDAARRLGDLGTPEAIAPLLRALEHRSSNVRANAVQSLGKIGGEGVFESLLQALEDGDFFVRAQAVRALAELGDRRAVAPLIQILADNFQSDLHSVIAFALGKLGDPEAIPALLNALETRNRSDLGNISSMFRNKYAPMLFSAIVRAMTNFEDPRATAMLLEALKSRANILQFWELQIFEPISIFEWIISWLLKCNHPHLFKILAQHLQDPDKNVRYEILRSIIAVNDAQLTNLIMASLQDPEPSHRQRSIQALRRRKDLQTTTAIISCLKDEVPMIRTEAALALGELGDKIAVKALIDSLQDQVYSVRGMAAWALGELQDSDAVADLTDSLKDDNVVVCKLAQEALNKIRASA